MQKWLRLNYSFVLIQNSLTNLVFEIKIIKNLLSGTRLVRHFEYEQKNNLNAAIFA